MSPGRDPTPDEFANFTEKAVDDDDTDAALLAVLGPDRKGMTAARGLDDRDAGVALAGVALRRAFRTSDADDPEQFLRDVVADFNDRRGELGVDE